MTYPITLLLAVLVLLGCRRDDPAPSTAAEYEALVADEMDRQHIPAMSVLIFQDDVVLYEKCFGQSNIQQELALENDHMFLIASISSMGLFKICSMSFLKALIVTPPISPF